MRFNMRKYILFMKCVQTGIRSAWNSCAVLSTDRRGAKAFSVGQGFKNRILLSHGQGGMGSVILQFMIRLHKTGSAFSFIWYVILLPKDSSFEELILIILGIWTGFFFWRINFNHTGQMDRLIWVFTRYTEGMARIIVKLIQGHCC